MGTIFVLGDPITIDATITLPTPERGMRLVVNNNAQWPAHVRDCCWGSARPGGTSRQRAATVRRRAQLRRRWDESTVTLQPGESTTITSDLGGWWAEEHP